MKNKDFFYLQYNKINWKNQEKTKINSFINDYIIKNVILKHRGKDLAIFDIGFGIGFFFKMLINQLSASRKYKHIIIEGCEPAKINYDYWLAKKPPKISKDITISVQKTTFQKAQTKTRFDFITAIYVFPHFLSKNLDSTARKIHSLLKEQGKFILVLANEKYLENKLKAEKDLSIEAKQIKYNNKFYKEILHYSDIPQIGKLIDYNREENYYLSLFKNNGFKLDSKKNLNDNGFICTLFIFSKKS